MKKVGVFYGSDTGCTEAIVAKIEKLINESVVSFIDVSQVKDKSELLDFENLILAIPTWYDGDLQSDWESFFPDFETLDFESRKVAIVGLGDQVGYGEYFVDGIGILAQSAMNNNAQLVGLTSIEGYDFEESKALYEVDGEQYFLGLALDEDNQSELTDSRLEPWISEVLQEFEVEVVEMK
jgi:flavodoxin I